MSSPRKRCVVVPSALSARPRCAARGADDERPRHGDADVVDAEVGVELGGGMELVRVPAGVLEHAELGEPLRDEVVVVDVAGAGERPRNLRRPLDLDRRARARRDRRDRDGHDRPVVGVAVVGRDEAKVARQVARRAVGRVQADGGDVDRSERVAPRRRRTGAAGARAARSSRYCARRSSRGETAARVAGVR